MRPLRHSFSIFIRQIAADNMLIAVAAAPIMIGFSFFFGVPAAERALCSYFGRTSVLSDYYLLFDLFLSLMTSYLFCFASGMVMLSEYDENMAVYLSVTPVGKKGYILSRLCFPAFISFAASAFLTAVFSLTPWEPLILLLTCLQNSASSVLIALLIFSFSRNRVEGLALGKLTGIFVAGLAAPFFISPAAEYLFWPLPAFWVGKLCLEKNLFLLLPAFLCTLLWVWVVYARFNKKLM